MELTAEHQLENKNLDPVFPGYEKNYSLKRNIRHFGQMIFFKFWLTTKSVKWLMSQMLDIPISFIDAVSTVKWYQCP